MDHEFVVRKQVQNRAIVREVDQARQRDLLRTVIGGACVLVTVLFAAWQHLDARRLDKEAADASARRRHGCARSIATSCSNRSSSVGPARVEAIATRQLRHEGADARDVGRHRARHGDPTADQRRGGAAVKTHGQGHAGSVVGARLRRRGAEQRPRGARRAARRSRTRAAADDRLAQARAAAARLRGRAAACCGRSASSARLVYLQVYQYDALVARAESQQSQTIELNPRRGPILDRYGRVLAYSVDGDVIYAVPSDVKDPEALATALCDALDRLRRRGTQVARAAPRQPSRRGPRSSTPCRPRKPTASRP